MAQRLHRNLMKGRESLAPRRHSMSLRQLDTPAAPARALLARRYRCVREQTLALAARLAVEDQVVQPCEEASPTK